MNLHDIEVKDINGKAMKLAELRGKTLLIVNVASQCGLTPQYSGLEAMHKKFKDKGFAVLGFPCDQFGHQEPGTEGEIKAFCESKYGVTFPMFSKIEVNGANAHPLFKFLRSAQPGAKNAAEFGDEKFWGFISTKFPEKVGTDDIKWNFTKFLVDKSGKVVTRFEPPVKPDAIEARVAELLK